MWLRVFFTRAPIPMMRTARYSRGCPEEKGFGPLTFPQHEETEVKTCWERNCSRRSALSEPRNCLPPAVPIADSNSLRPFMNSDFQRVRMRPLRSGVVNSSSQTSFASSGNFDLKSSFRDSEERLPMVTVIIRRPASSRRRPSRLLPILRVFPSTGSRGKPKNFTSTPAAEEQEPDSKATPAAEVQPHSKATRRQRRPHLLRLIPAPAPAPAPVSISINTGEFDVALGRSYAEIAAEGRSLHRSQGQGAVQNRGPSTTSLQLVQKTVDVADNADLFAGVVYKLPDLAQLEAALGAELNQVEQRVTNIRQKANIAKPADLVPDLTEALKQLQQIRMRATNEHVRFVLQQKEGDFEEAIRLAAGLVLDVLASDETVVPGQEFNVTVSIINGGPYTYSSASINFDLPAGWEARLAPPPEPGQGARGGRGRRRPWRRRWSRRWSRCTRCGGRSGRWSRCTRRWSRWSRPRSRCSRRWSRRSGRWSRRSTWWSRCSRPRSRWSRRWSKRWSRPWSGRWRPWWRRCHVFAARRDCAGTEVRPGLHG